MRTSSTSISPGERMVRPSARRVIVHPRPEHVDGIERADPRLQPGEVTLLAGEHLRGASGKPCAGAKEALLAIGQRAAGARLQLIDPHGEPLVGTVDRSMRAPGDAMRPLSQRPGLRAQSVIRHRGNGGEALLDSREVAGHRLDECGRTGGRRLQGRVGDVVGDAAIDLVTEAGQHGDGCGGDRSGDRLGVEGRQLVARAPAPDEHDDVEAARRWRAGTAHGWPA